MSRSVLRRFVGAWLFVAIVLGRRELLAQGASASVPSPTPTPAPAAARPAPVREDVVVSATKMVEEEVDVPNAVTVVKGEELRRRGTRTLADALQDVVGLDTGNGSDNGPRLPNIGVYGIKEFDALLITVDGIPVGGPFNPNLVMIPVDDIDRIEIVRGPQGTLYGVSAFAGMVQVFTRHDTGGTWGSARVGGFGAFEQGYGDVNVGTEISPGFKLRVNGSIARGDGWQDRTDFKREQLRLSFENTWGETKLDTSILWLRDTNFWGSPLPVDAGEVLPGFAADRNYAVGDARVDHHVIGLFTRLSTPITGNLRFENVLSVTRDNSDAIRSWVNGTFDNFATAEGISLHPKETVVYDDAHVIAGFRAAGQHHMVGGAALTWGRTTAAGHGFDIDLQVSPEPVVPDYRDIPFGDNRNFNDRRTFVGLYLNDEWTPVSWFTLMAGGRYDFTSEKLHVFQQEIGDPNFDTVDDERKDNKFSWGVSGLFRLLAKPTGPMTAVNLYGAARRNFKPAAPNLSEAENARILNPETTVTQEAGLKTLWMDGALSFNVTWFHMIFNNLVVSELTPDGPALTNAGKERFQGWEFETGYALPMLAGLSVYGGYAHHDARFIRFSFLTPDGTLRVVDGKRLELAPRDLWNVKLVMAPRTGFGGFVAVRHQNQRPLNRRNTFWTPSFVETDAGLSYDFERFRIAVIGRNLGDSRHYTTESEIGDSQFYVAAPRGVTAELTVRF
jgi:outer membrane receptor protein involved in Fe transport